MAGSGFQTSVDAAIPHEKKDRPPVTRVGHELQYPTYSVASIDHCRIGFPRRVEASIPLRAPLSTTPDCPPRQEGEGTLPNGTSGEVLLGHLVTCSCAVAPGDSRPHPSPLCPQRAPAPCCIRDRSAFLPRPRRSGRWYWRNRPPLLDICPASVKARALRSGRGVC